MANTFSIGSFVINFGVIAEIIAFDPLRGLLLKEVSTLTHKGCGQWYADPAKCEPYAGRTAYKTGLVVFD